MVLGKKLYIFSGIPYAMPPTGRRRFRKPVPVRAWEGRVKIEIIKKTRVVSCSWALVIIN